MFAEEYFVVGCAEFEDLFTCNYLYDLLVYEKSGVRQKLIKIATIPVLSRYTVYLKIKFLRL